MSQTCNVNQHLNGEELSKKKKLHPRDEEDEYLKSSKKLKTGTKSVSKSKISTQKKCEVTFCNDVEEIKENENSNKENSEEAQTTPIKAGSPSKASLKSVKEHIKTPFSKVKDSSEEQILTPTLLNSKGKNKQLNFSNSDIVNQSSNKSVNNKSANKKSSRDNTPNKTANKLDQGRSASKSPLQKIVEETNVDSENNKKMLNVSPLTFENILQVVQENTPSVFQNVECNITNESKTKIDEEITREPIIKTLEESEITSEVFDKNENNLEENKEKIIEETISEQLNQNLESANNSIKNAVIKPTENSKVEPAEN